MFARDARTVLLANNGRLSLQHFEAAFAQHWGVSLVPPAYGHPSVCALLQAVPHVATIRGKGYRRLVLLTPEFQGTSTLPPSVNMGTTIASDKPYAENARYEPSDQSTEQPQDTSSTMHTGANSITSPSNDSGITECTTFSTSDTSSPPESSADVESKMAKPKTIKAQRQLSFDPGNIPVPDMFSTYDECLASTPKKVSTSKTPSTMKTPCSTMLNMAAQLLPQENPPCVYTPNGGYHLTRGQPYPYQYGYHQYPPNDSYQSYMYAQEQYGQDYYVGISDYQGNYCDNVIADKEGNEYNGASKMNADHHNAPSMYPQGMPSNIHGHMPITCESLEASSLLSANSQFTIVPTLESASAKLKDLCVSAPPPSLSHIHLGLSKAISKKSSNKEDHFNGMETDEQNPLAVNLDYNKYRVKSVPFVKLCSYPDVCIEKVENPEIGSSGTCVPLISPRKKRLAARFDMQPNVD